MRDDAHRFGIPFRAMLHRVLQRGLDAAPTSGPASYQTPSVPLGLVREGVNLVKALQLSAALEDDDRAKRLYDGRQAVIVPDKRRGRCSKLRRSWMCGSYRRRFQSSIRPTATRAFFAN